jgi:hypothetical protein
LATRDWWPPERRFASGGANDLQYRGKILVHRFIREAKEAIPRFRQNCISLLISILLACMYRTIEFNS